MEVNRRTGLTNTTARLLQRAELNEEAQTPGAGKGKAGHAGATGQDKRGISKATFNISAEAQALIAEIAESEDCPKNDVVEVAVRVLAELRRARSELLGAIKYPARLLDKRWRLEPDEEFWQSLKR